MQLTWLGAAGFKMDTSEGAILLIDPYLSRPAEARPFLSLQLVDLMLVDEIFLTDGRFDHALDTPALARQTGAIVHAVEPVCRHLEAQGVSTHNLESIIPQTFKRVGNLSWQALASQHPAEEEVAYSFRIDGLVVVHFSSTSWAEAEVHDLQPDLALLPVESQPDGGTAAARLAAWLQPKVVIPHHWDNYSPPLSESSDLAQFETALNLLAPQIRVYKPIIGQCFDPIRLLF